jgi:hypothetical protein
MIIIFDSFSLFSINFFSDLGRNLCISPIYPFLPFIFFMNILSLFGARNLLTSSNESRWQPKYSCSMGGVSLFLARWNKKCH